MTVPPVIAAAPFQNSAFQTTAPQALAKKKTKFLFGGRAGFKVCHNKRYHPVQLPGLSNSRKTTHIPDVTRLLIQKYYFAGGKEPASAVAVGGGIFPRY
jgi:hypothetical protein